MLKSVRRLGGTPIIVALVLVLAIGGTATAAKLITGKAIKNHSLTGKDIKKGSIKSPSLSKGAKSALKGSKGAKGDTGATGAAGATGDTGAPGLTGPPSAWMGRLTGLSTSSGSNEFGFVSSPSAATSSANDRSLLMPPFELRATRLNVLLNDNPGGLTSRVFTLSVNGDDTALSCSVPGAGISCFSTTPVVIPASASVTLKAATNLIGAGPDAANANYAITLERP